ncbi:siderophore-interacting protein [Brevibacterium sp.]|uniref:siderophore-interacting protein n=1 Tax=Brevibacterium sp. TaxID=1701 RepID=UPI00262A924F|nr:siderophore-interacting protein [Brevibacterium sp.]
MRITNHEVIVTGIEDFTARYRRIHFSGPELLAQLDEVFPTLWTRLWFPHPEKGEGHLSQRGYTFAAIDLEAGTFSLDFVLHGDASASTAGSGPGAAGGGSGTADIGTADTGTADVGPGARWAARARPGTRIEAALTRPASTCPTTPPTSSSPVTSPRCRPSTPGARPSPPRWP